MKASSVISDDSGYEEYKEAAENQASLAQEAISALEQQVSSDAAELKRLKTQLKKREDQVRALTTKLEARSQPSTFPALKEEIYQDLTGLVISSIHKEGDDSVLNCLQTGRNGTLHYKLHWPKSAHEQITYTPLLDDDRDGRLAEVLPDYLREDIMFAQDQASLFAYRLWTAIQRK